MKSYENHQIRQTVSNRKSKKHSVAFFERGSWYHRTKSLDEKGNIKYGKKGGFSTQKEAEDDYWLCLEEFEKSRLLVCEDVGSITLGDYLKKWFENEKDDTPFIKYLLGTILAAYRDFEDRVNVVNKKMNSFEMVEKAVNSKLGKFTKSDIMELCPEIGRASVENALKKLCDDGKIEKHGAGRSTFYSPKR